ncbi:MAG: metal-sensing transcriptional repressor [Candidatus Roizmanbacteria bacterium]|nr:metal-sensing transcriptional repressor [Candidatus Roizmanbacteria bacterium]MCR4313493.1 metal-sensing transcriptional repressor [Candidatus Roizmanbacteria bacterium]
MGEQNNKVLHRLKIAKGHLEKVIKMLENDEYCLNVIQQTQAVTSSLEKVSELILENHLKTCVRESMESGKDIDEKVKEVMEVFKRK